MGRDLFRTMFALAYAIAILSVLPARADQDTALAVLKQPGVHAIMRHALAPGTGDPAEFDIDDCGTQRNLDENGRNQARAIGKALKHAGIEFDRILTSQWCRCRETAQLLGLGQPEESPALNSFFADRATAKEQTRAVRNIFGSIPEGDRLMLVTHQVNITALTGSGVSSGEVLLVKKTDAGDIDIVSRILARP